MTLFSIPVIYSIPYGAALMKTLLDKHYTAVFTYAPGRAVKDKLDVSWLISEVS